MGSEQYSCSSALNEEGRIDADRLALGLATCTQSVWVAALTPLTFA